MKYTLTPEGDLFRLTAETDDVYGWFHKGDRGGLVASEHTLSQEKDDHSWVDENCIVSHHLSRVYDNARVRGGSHLKGEARVGRGTRLHAVNTSPNSTLLATGQSALTAVTLGDTTHLAVFESSTLTHVAICGRVNVTRSHIGGEGTCWIAEQEEGWDTRLVITGAVIPGDADIRSIADYLSIQTAHWGPATFYRTASGTPPVRMAVGCQRPESFHDLRKLVEASGPEYLPLLPGLEQMISDMVAAWRPRERGVDVQTQEEAEGAGEAF